jgi:hypothetical protein
MKTERKTAIITGPAAARELVNGLAFEIDGGLDV